MRKKEYMEIESRRNEANQKIADLDAKIANSTDEQEIAGFRSEKKSLTVDFEVFNARQEELKEEVNQMQEEKDAREEQMKFQ